jgi:hypothetical protein
MRAKNNALLLGSKTNRKFDTSLRTQNPEWGVRDIEDVVDVADKRGLDHLQTVDMPANNLCVLFRKR